MTALRGHLDAITAGGFAEGWAFDPAAPSRALTVRLLGTEGEEVALGLATLHRADLAGLGYRHGWCAFRLRLGLPAELLRGVPLTLQEAAKGQVLQAGRVPAWREAAGLDACPSVEAALAQDPTTLRNLGQLSGCAPLLEAFVARHGAAAFVEAAFAYVLGRAADAPSLALHERLLGNGAVTPLGLLAILAGTEEFRARRNAVASPASPGFPFA